MTLWMENLLRPIALVEEKLAEAKAEEDEFDDKDYSGWFARHRAATDKLVAFFREEENGRFTQQGAHGHTVQMAGIKSTSTSGWYGALQNWKRAAETKVANAAGTVVDADPINLQGSGPAPIVPRESP